MKKYSFLFIFVLFCCSFSSFSQRILQSKIVYNKAIHTDYYVFIKADASLVEEEWKKYLDNVQEESSEYLVSSVKSSEISDELNRIVSYVKNHEDFSKLSIILLNEQDLSLESENIAQETLEKFLYDFYDVIYFKEEVSMAEEDLAFMTKQISQAESELSKAEKSLASNLKAQEKFGKRLESAPDDLKQLEETNDEIRKGIAGDTDLENEEENNISPIEPVDLGKQLSKSDKQIKKAKKANDKNANSLKKLESEYEDLVLVKENALLLLANSEKVLESKRLVLAELKK